MIDCLPWWQVMGQQAPDATSTQDVEDGIQNLTNRMLSRGLPPGLGLGAYGAILCHSVSVKSVGYGLLLGCSVIGIGTS